MSFKELRLAEPIVRAIAAEGYKHPTPIQMKAIPEALAGRDVLGCAQTGTGKTGAFAMPTLHRLHASRGSASESSTAGSKNGGKHNGQRPPKRLARALVLCPTRELAMQIFESFQTYGRRLSLRHTVIFGGVSQARQVRDLRAGVDVIIATPGRLLDLIGQGFVDLSAIEVLTLDEADRMLDMGFIHDIRRIVQLLPRRRQTLFFSATMPPETQRLADSLLHEPVIVKVDPVDSTVDAVTQSVYHVVRKHKPELLERLLLRNGMGRTLVFTRTKHGADRLVKRLGRSGINVGAIHGNKTQNARTRALKDFKNGRAPVLIATDIASRGIDVDEITHVINFDLPSEPETYIHRIGRTARAGASGVALSFCDQEQVGDLRAIERLIRTQLDVIVDEPDLAGEAPKVEPRRNGEASARNSGAKKPRNNNRYRSRTNGSGGRSTSASRNGKRDSSKRGFKTARR